jgi:hypothetical protein
MKTLRLLSAALGLAAIGALHAADRPAASARTEVIFDHPENFADVKDASFPSDRGRDEILARIRDHLVSRAAPMIPDGDRLTITFTDIDLAGDFEPWRGSRFDNVRFVKPIYPPSFKFTYAVTDASGRVVKSGTERLQDLAFQDRVALDTSDSLRYEKLVLDDWARSALGGLKKR